MVIDNYALLDSGQGKKLERFNAHVIIRPASQAIWMPSLPIKVWESADATFTREGGCKWRGRHCLDDSWHVDIAGITFKLSSTDFGHLGVFPEQRSLWQWIRSTVAQRREQAPNLLNLFAYSGGATIAAAQGGAQVCHLDASQGMVSWARDNAALNGLQAAPIRWIVDDVHKFLGRELRRQRHYDAIILDPPTFGRGSHGELFKIEEHLPAILSQCRRLLSRNPLFILLSCHTPGITPTVLAHLLSQHTNGLQGSISNGELLLEGAEAALPLPSGAYALWRQDEVSTH